MGKEGKRKGGKVSCELRLTSLRLPSFSRSSILLKQVRVGTELETEALTSLLIIIISELSLHSLGDLDGSDDEMILSLTRGVRSEEKSVDGVICSGRSAYPQRSKPAPGKREERAKEEEARQGRRERMCRGEASRGEGKEGKDVISLPSSPSSSQSLARNVVGRKDGDELTTQHQGTIDKSKKAMSWRG